jgi:ribulose-bisphosphate carboxylase large chain
MPTAAQRIFATYRVETPLELARAAEALAGEQSSGTFVQVPGETADIRERFGARLEKLAPTGESPAPSLPGSRSRSAGDVVYRQAELTISWPLENVGANLPALLSMIQGNLYELSQFSGLKLLDIDLPQSFTAAFAGPRFGVEGTRRLTNVPAGRPMIGTIVKPSIGLTPAQTAELVRTLAAAGIDFIKDDELMSNPPSSPFADRVEAVMRVINDHADRTSRKVMYAFNVTDELDTMLRNYDRVVAAGGTCAMVSINMAGLTGVMKLCDRGRLAIHAHRNGWGMLSRHPFLGIEFSAYEKIWRLAGVDQLHVNGIANKFWEDDDSVVRSIQSCLAELHDKRPIVPVISSGQTGVQAPETYRRTQTTDVLYLAGGGIMAHPSGPAAGVAAIRQAWEAAVNGISLEQYARDHVELREQLVKFDRK